MFNFFRFRKLNAFLGEVSITGKSTEKLRLEKFEVASETIFNLLFEEGRQNFARIIEMLYERQSAATRIKLLVLIHYLIMEDRSYAKQFLHYPRGEFQGLLIPKKQHQTQSQTHKYTEAAGDQTLRGPETSASVTRTCITRRQIDDDINYSDVNVYLHLYLVLPYLSHLLRICGSYELYE
jgi:hypothetical protein